MMKGLAVAVFLVACSATSNGPGDTQPPSLHVLTPDRGTLSAGSQVTVTGTATDDQPGLTVTVNGTPAAVGADGSFSATITVGSGVDVLETHATDAAGNDARDVRAVLAGTLAATDGSTVSPLGAMIGAAGFHALGTAIATQAKQLDFTALGQAMNPVYSSSGCNSATIDIETITVGDITADLVPGANVLAAKVDLSDVAVTLEVKFKAVCIGGNATVDVHSTVAHVTGNLALGLEAGKLVATMPDAAVVLDGFSINIHNIPGAIEDLIRGKVRDAAESALTKAIKDEVPKVANEQLSKLVSQSLATQMLGHDLRFTVTPSGVALSPDGLFVATDTTLLLAGGEGGTFASVAAPLDATTIGASGLGIAIAADTLNQLLGGAWAAGAIDQHIADLGGVGGLLDDDVHSLVLHPLLPPTVTADNGTLALALGDMIVSARDANDTEVIQVALSVSTPLQIAAGANSALAFDLGDPVVKAQVLAQTDAVDNPLTDAKFEAIIGGGWGLLAGKAKDALSGLALPTLSGVTLGTPAVAGTHGYIVATIPLQ
jgi:hypothetical protein